MEIKSSSTDNLPAGGFRVPAEEIFGRISSLQKYMRSHKMAGALLVQRIDIFYFSGTARSGYLYIPAQGEASLCIRRHLPRAVV